MKNITIKLPALVAACTFAACTSVTVTTDYDHTAPFGKYKTYALAPAKKDQALSPVSEAALRDTVHSELTARGITQATNGKPDLAIVRHVVLTDQVSVEQYHDWGYGYHGGWPYGYGSYGMWSGGPVTYFDVSRYTEGSLILDVVDTHTKKLVFRGVGTAVVSSSASDNAAAIREAVKKMADAIPK